MRAFLIVLGLVLLFFGIDEWVERLWSRGVESESLHVFHLVRGVVASVIAAAMVGWLIARAAPRPGELSADWPHWWEHGGPTMQQWTATYAQWFIVMRWIAVVVATGMVLLVTRIPGLLSSEATVPLLITLLVLGATNVIYWAVLRSGRWHSYLLPAQIYADLVILTALLHFSGGIEDPLSLVMVFHVIIAGIVLSRAQCYEVAATATALYVLMALAEYGHWVDHYTLALFPHVHTEHGVVHAAHMVGYTVGCICVQGMVLFLSAYFVTTLAERVRFDERQLAVMADRANTHRQLIEQSLETTGTGLRVLDRDLRPYWSNGRWQEWFGAEGAVVDSAKQTLEDGCVRVTEITLAAKKVDVTFSEKVTSTFFGRRTLQLTTAPLRDKSGAVAQVVELAQDITQQKETQAQMVRADKLAAVGQLAGQVAHEVNNPIAIISAKSRLLLEDHRQELSEHTAGELEKITALADRVARIAQGLLSSSRPSTGARAALDIRLPIRMAMSVIEQRARAGGLQVEDRLPDLLPLVLGNSSEIEQVFLNLLLNALDATASGGRITVGGRPAGGEVEAYVEDSGSGMSPEVRNRIFEPFFSTKEQGRGTGLGLSICLGLVRSHGGNIDVQSEPGRGSRFMVRLPVLGGQSSEAQAHD